MHSYGGLVFHDVINVRHARKAAQQGVDGIIIVCAGAGGHAGLAVRSRSCAKSAQFFDGTLVLAGAMSSGADVLAAQAIGADLAYLGTRFLATTEAHVLPEYKQMIVESSSDDVVYTSLFTGVKGNYLRKSVAAAGFDPDNLPEADKSKMNFGSGGNCGQEGLARHLERRSGRRQHPRGDADAGARRTDGGRVRRGEASPVRGLSGEALQ